MELAYNPARRCIPSVNYISWITLHETFNILNPNVFILIYSPDYYVDQRWYKIHIMALGYCSKSLTLQKTCRQKSIKGLSTPKYHLTCAPTFSHMFPLLIFISLEYIVWKCLPWFFYLPQSPCPAPAPHQLAPSVVALSFSALCLVPGHQVLLQSFPPVIGKRWRKILFIGVKWIALKSPTYSTRTQLILGMDGNKEEKNRGEILKY